MKTAVMTDSNSGISQQEADALGLFMMPMPVIIDGETHYEGIDLTHDSFFSALTGGRDVTTSQPSPGDLMDRWDKILSSGYDELIYIPMSSGLSNSCSTAISLSAEYNGKVQVADNHRISVTMRASIEEAIAYASNGISAAEIKRSLEENAYNSSIYIAVDTLEFLKKGGRVTPAGAALGAVLNIKPILTIQGERLDAFAKVRGMKKAKQKIVEALQNDFDTRFKDIPTERLRLGAAGSGLTPAEREDWRATLANAFPQFDIYYDPLSFSICCHVGPQSYGVGISVIAEK
ncbi:MAG: DegV family protein [Firmicutes bacterium]|nr:DegV family protein [Lachnospiraceae bacterium]MDD6066614.1 DegV family protein [Bacillota bacterium]MDY2820640.1 DegV family protein [Hominisplanchenecus sp.]